MSRFTRCLRCGRKARLFECKHCGNYYCEEHSEPKLPLTPSMVFNEKNPVLSQLYEKEWRKGGHACVPYGEWKLNEIKEREKELTDKVMETLDKMKEVPIRRPQTFERFKPTSRPWKYNPFGKNSFYKESTPHTIRNKKFYTPSLSWRTKKRLKNILLIAVFIIIVYLIYSNRQLITNTSLFQHLIDSARNYLKIDLSEDLGLFLLVALIFFIILFFISKMAFKVVMFTVIAVVLVIFFVSMFRPSIQTAGQEVGKTVETVSGKPEINITELEKEIHNSINTERTSYGLSQLQWDDKLADIARAHSIDMSLNGYFSHIDLKGQDPTARATSAGYSCFKSYGSYYTNGIAENIFQNNLYDSVTYVNGIPIYNWNSQSELASSTVNGWMNSPGHRQNILTPTYDKEGIGVAISSDDKVYITEDFC